MVSDIVLTTPLPDVLAENLLAYVGCVSGAILLSDYEKQIKAAGFETVKVDQENGGLVELWLTDPDSDAILANAQMTQEEAADIGRGILSAKISGVKPTVVA